jgi:transposase
VSKQLSYQANGLSQRTTGSTAEIGPPAERQRRSAADKLRILQEYAAYPAGSPERGALVRREGSSTAHISKWRKQRDGAVIAGLSPQRRGPAPSPRHPLEDDVERLRKEHARLRQAETIIPVQKN